MEQRFTLEGGGVLTVREEGLRAVVAAQRPNDGRGLYRAYLQGAGGQVLLGTMAPEGAVLKVRRTFSLDELRRQGAWPPRSGRAELSFSFTDSKAPEGWHRADPAGLRFREAELFRAAVQLGRALYRREGEGFALAYPFSCREPFPFPQLFCLAEPAELDGQRYLLFHFDTSGWPVLPEPFRQGGGENWGRA